MPVLAGRLVFVFLSFASWLFQTSSASLIHKFEKRFTDLYQINSVVFMVDWKQKVFLDHFLGNPKANL